MTTTAGTFTQHADGTVSVEFEDPGARTLEVSIELVTLFVATVSAAPIVRELAAEAMRAHAQHGATSMRSQPWNSHRRVSILAEELGEVARPLNDLDHGKISEADAVHQARGELVQLGAMVVDWIAALDEAAR